MRTITDLRVQLFADGADKAHMLDLYRQPYIKGFTTNPTLMRATGVTDYQQFAMEVLAAIPDRPISFEVLGDDQWQMEEEARHIARWGKNVFVKVPVMNTRGEPTYELVRSLSEEGIALNVTALLTLEQVHRVCRALEGGTPAFVSVFAGRIADTGRDPGPVIREAVAMANSVNAKLIWASPRELLNIFQAEEAGCHVITATADVLKKLSLIGKDLNEFSRETVQMFRDDAVRSGFSLPLVGPRVRKVARSA